MVFSASSTTQVLSNGGLSDSAFYLKRTLMFGAVGLVIMHLTARHGLTAIRRADAGPPRRLALPAARRARRRHQRQRRQPLDRRRLLQIQPSELAKVALVLYAADLLARKPKRVRSIEGLMPFLLVVGAACAADHARARHGDDDGRSPSPSARP